MKYQQIFPIEPLRKYVRYFWTLEDNRLNSVEGTFKILSDGLPGMIFQENPTAFRSKENEELPQCFLYGQTTGYKEQQAIDSFKNFGIYFQPNAIKSIFGIDAYELTNRHIDINDIVKTNMAERLLENVSTEERIKLLSSFLVKHIEKRKIENENINFATTLLQNGLSLQKIQQELNISERTLERFFKQHIGISPKLYARISRFQSALENIRDPQFYKLTDISYRADYFDQSHFIRDFKEFAGASPTQFKLKANEIVANFPEWKI